MAITREIPAEDFAQWMSDWLDSLAKADVSHVLNEMGNEIRKGVARAFATETGPDGPWEPRHIDVGVMRGMFPADFARPLLVLTGNLIEAAALRGVGSIHSVGPQSLQVGVRGDVIPYAATHQFGGRVYLTDMGKEIDIVPRPYFYVTTDTLDRCEGLLVEYLATEVLA